jgi:hypothetical protein
MYSKHVQHVLFVQQVADIFTEERRKVEGPEAPEIGLRRVHDFHRRSKPTPPNRKNPDTYGGRNRYENHPMPYARMSFGGIPIWAAEQEDDLRAWYHDRMPDASRDQDRVEARKAEWAKALAEAARKKAAADNT